MVYVWQMMKYLVLNETYTHLRDRKKTRNASFLITS
jgi:hypothetical protein